MPLGVAGAPLCRCSSASAGRMRRRMRLRTDSGGGGCTAKRSSSGANGTEVHKHDSRRSAVIVAANKMAELVRESLIASSTGAMVARSTRSFIARARRVCLHLAWKTRVGIPRNSYLLLPSSGGVAKSARNSQSHVREGFTRISVDTRSIARRGRGEKASSAGASSAGAAESPRCRGNGPRPPVGAGILLVRRTDSLLASSTVAGPSHT